MVKTIWVQVIFIFTSYISLIVKAIIEQSRSTVNQFQRLLLSNRHKGRWCAALRRLRKRPAFSARSGEDATARLTDFCGAAAPQHRREAPVKGGFGVATPTSSRPGEQMSGSEIWATGRYLLSTTNAFPMPAHRSVTVQQIRQQKRICRSNLPDKRELTGFCFCDFRYCQL